MTQLSSLSCLSASGYHLCRIPIIPGYRIDNLCQRLKEIVQAYIHTSLNSHAPGQPRMVGPCLVIHALDIAGFPQVSIINPSLAVDCYSSWH
ncbi:MAG: hypothetical protein AB2672_19140 [Candidatus Thiodiazotropha endolucinida]|nr:hypothetical protein [Candidatus Thiodiazotropha taylori]